MMPRNYSRYLDLPVKGNSPAEIVVTNVHVRVQENAGGVLTKEFACPNPFNGFSNLAVQNFVRLVCGFQVSNGIEGAPHKISGVSENRSVRLISHSCYKELPTRRRL